MNGAADQSHHRLQFIHPLKEKIQMSNARPSNRQLQDFRNALQAAQVASASLPSLATLAARRDAHLASLR